MILNYAATWTKWGDAWAVRIHADEAQAEANQQIEVESRSGSVKTVTLGEFVAQDDYGQIWTIRKEASNSLPVGYYFKNETVYKITLTKDGQRSYAKRLEVTNGRGKWVYEQGAARVLTSNDAITVDQAAAFGHLHGICAICGATLTNPESVERGIGPVCLEKI